MLYLYYVIYVTAQSTEPAEENNYGSMADDNKPGTDQERGNKYFQLGNI